MYLKQRHQLVEMRREQYTLRDAYVDSIPAGEPEICAIREADFDVEIEVLPLGTIGATERQSLVF